MPLALNLPVGLTGTAELVVGEQHTAPRIGSGRIHVLATPVMINLFEAAALAAVEHLLPQGKMTYHGRPVNPASIKRMGLMTVEGEKDDICSIGQTLAAQDLCTGVRAYRKVHHMQAGVGHYGVFSGRRWNNEIYPLLRDFVHVNS